MDYYIAYVETKKQEEMLSEEIKKLEARYIKPLQDAKAKIIELKDEAKEKMMADMAKKGIKTKDIGTNLISLAEKKTISIIDGEFAMHDMVENPDIQKRLSKLTGKTKTELRSLLIKVSLNNKEAVPLAENLFKTDGVLPKGIEERVTVYPVVKDK